MKGRILWPALGVLTVATYNTWLCWRPLNGHPEIFDGYLSELSATDQPYDLFFRGGDLVTAVILVALGLHALRLWRHRGAWWTVAAAALLLFGVSTFLDSFLGMDCSPTLNEACRVAEATGQLSTAHYAHTVTSVGAQAGIVASMVASAIALLRTPRRSRSRTRAVLVVAAVEVVALAVMLVMIAADVPGLGYPQAAMVVVASLWFAAIGFGLVGPDAGTRRDPALAGSTELVGERG